MVRICHPLIGHQHVLWQYVDDLLSWLDSVRSSLGITPRYHAFDLGCPYVVAQSCSLVGRLLWLTSAWHYLRPLLQTLYRALHHLPVSMIGMDHLTFHKLCSNLSEDMTLRSDLSSHHHTLIPGLRLVRVANTYPQTKQELAALHLKSRRVWVGVLDPIVHRTDTLMMRLRAL